MGILLKTISLLVLSTTGDLELDSGTDWDKDKLIFDFFTSLIKVLINCLFFTIILLIPLQIFFLSESFVCLFRIGAFVKKTSSVHRSYFT